MAPDRHRTKGFTVISQRQTPGATWLRRAVPIVVLALLLPLFASTLTAMALTARAMTLTDSRIVNGDYVMVGNGVLRCDPTKPKLSASTPAALDCTTLHNGTAGTNFVNDFLWMGNVDVDSNGTTANSSRATVTIPSGSSVVKAVLYWSGNTGLTRNTAGNGNLTGVCGTNALPAGGAYVSPSGSPSARDVSVNFGSTTFTAAPTKYTVETDTTLAAGQPQYYSAQADITSQLASLPSGSAQTITVGNLWAMQGFGCYAGWSLAVVYSFPDFDPANAVLTNARQIFLYDGHIRKQAADPAAEVVPITGFTAEAPGSRGGFTLYEGDRNITGDFAQYRSNTAAAPTLIPNSLSPSATNNIGVSQSDGSVSYQPGATPFINANTDVRNLALTGITTGDTSMNFSLDTTGDSFLLQNIILSVPTAAIRIDKSFNGTLDEQTVAVGTAPTFTIKISNAGGVPLKGLIVTDPLAPGCARNISGTLGVAPAANSVITYTCTGLPATAAFTNTATVDSKSDLGGDFSDSDDSIVHVPRIDVEKSASPTIIDPGGSTTWTITVTNIGDEPLANVATTDVAVPACARTNLGTLAVGASTTYTCTSTGITAGFTNSVTATGNSPAGVGVRATDVATADVKIRRISITKAGTPTALNIAGDSAAYTFIVTNTGEVPLSNVAVTDVLQAPATPVPTVTCPKTTLAVGEQMTCTTNYVAKQADVDKGDITNSATVSATDAIGGVTTASSNTVVIPIASAPAVTVTKSATPTSVAAAGATVNYSFLVRNTGNVTLTSIAVTDTFTAPAGPPLAITCPTGALPPGGTRTCTATYTVTQADVNAGSVQNSAVARGTPPAGGVVTSPPSSATVTAAPAPAISIVKSASPTTATAAGQTVTYSFTVRNTGNVTLTSVGVVDTFTAPAGPEITPTCLATTLAPNATTTCSATYTVTQADVNRGRIDNSAVSRGTSPSGSVVQSTPSTAAVTIASAPALTVTKSASPTTVGTAGSTVAYSFLVRNTGNVTLTGITVADTFVAPAGPANSVSCPVTTLNPGATTTCTATYTVTQADIDAGSIQNTARATGTPPTGPAVTSPPSSATVTATPAPAITVTKSASPTTVTAAGQTVAYSFLVRNTGNVTLTNLTVTDTLTAPAGPPLAITCPVTSLAPNATTTCTATYTVTQVDMNAGSVQNSATARGTPPTGSPVTSPPSAATVTATPAPSLSIVKSANPASVSAAGQTVAYSFLVRNTGNVTLTGVSVTDTFTAPAGPALTVSCPATTLAPDATTTCTASYTVTQADIDAGSIQNSAVARGTTPAGGTITSPPSAATVTAAPTPQLTVTKSAVPTTVTSVGQTVAYSFLVRNTGNVTLTGLSVADTFTAPAGPELTVVCPVTSLAPNATTTCTASYSVTQADLDAGSIQNSAIATGTPPTGAPVSTPPSTATVTATPAPSLEIVKSADPTTVTAAGETVSYSFVVTNTGNVTLTGVGVTDTFTAPAGPALSVTCPDTTLAPNASTTCTATYTVTQADVDAGSIQNSATASGTPPTGPAVTSPPSTATVTAAPAPVISIVKSADPTTVATAGETVTYSFVVTNDGNVTLTDVSVVDTFSAPAGPELTVSCPSTTLAPGASVTCTATYTVTQADIDNDSIDNSAVAEGTPPGGGAPVVSDPGVATVDVTATPSIALVKSASPTTIGTAGALVTYQFAVTNTGNVTLSDVAIDDQLAAPAGPALSITCPVTTLAPGASTTCSATYTATQDDIDNGVIDNEATASGTPPGGAAAVQSDPSTAQVTATSGPAISIVKTADPTTVTAAGATVTYSFLVANAGNVSLSGVTVTDTLTAPAGPPLTITCPSTTLAVGSDMTCEATYVVTQADVDAGSIVNSASVSGNPPTGPAVTADSTATVTAPAAASLSIVKSADPTTINRAGEDVTYSFLVTNTGNVTVDDVAVVDTFTAPAGPELVVTCPGTSLEPGESTTCEATYVASQADVDAGSIQNSAVATGTPPAGAPPVTSPPSEATVAIPANAQLAIVKDATPSTISGVGETVTYDFYVTNSGNVTVTDVAVDDTLTAPAGPPLVITCDDTSLDPQQTTRCTATYVSTQADVDAGEIRNTAFATGTGPTGDTVESATDDALVVITSSPEITIVKSADPTTVTSAGDVVDYSFEVTNTGNVTLTDVEVTDTFTAPAGPELTVACPVTTLAPGESTTCTASYPVTQADVDAGSIQNSAVATGTPPNAGTPVDSEPSEATVTATAAPAISIVKSADPTTVSTVGDTVDYAFVVTNTGNVTLTDVVVTDTFTAPAGPELVVTCPVTTLAPSESTTCSASYTVTQADVDNGVIENSAIATGTPPGGGSPVDSDPSGATVEVLVDAAITIVKTADPTAVTAAGDTVDYSFEVTNASNVTLSNVAVSDTLTAPAGPPLAITCPVTTLAPGESTTCTATYTVTQADIDAGSIQNSATSSGTTPAGDPVTSGPSDATVTADPAPAISILKSADPTTVSSAGDLVEYTFAVTNDGNVTLTDITVTDTFTAPAGPELVVTCPVTTLAPGATTQCIVSYTVTQDDVDAGSIQNSAVAAGTTPGGAPVESDPSEATVTADPTPALSILKSADPVQVTAAGDTVDYSFVVTNTGNVTLTDVTVTDTFTAPAGPELVVTCPVTTLAPSESTTCTATYTVTQADVDAGAILNSAVATGTPPGGNPPVDSPPSEVTVDVPATPAVTIIKSASPTTVTAAGDTVDYSFLVTNTGNVTLTGVSVSDTFTAPAGPPLVVTCPETTLLPDASTSCTATYTVTQADVDAGSIQNSAVANGTPPGAPPIASPPSEATVTVTPTPAISIVKSADPTTVTAAGDSVAYSFVVTNTGNVTLTDVTVTDTFTAPAGPELVVTCPVTALAPSESTTCTATYTVTQADVDAGSIQNSAIATGTPPNGGAPVDSEPSEATVTATPAPAVTIVKTADPTTVTAAGDTVDYSFVVTNTGNVTLTDVVVTDTFTAPAGPELVVTCPVTTLAPSESTTCTASYTVTQADVDAGSIQNSAIATGTPPNGGAPVDSEPSEATVTATPAPALTIVKTADPTTVTAAGDSVAYEFLVTNTGNVTLTDLVVTDTFTAPAGPELVVSCPVTTLAPSESTTCTATYTVTQADVDNGLIANSAIATGTPPNGGAAVDSEPSEATVTATPAPAVTIVKTADPTTVTAAGDTVDYTFVVTNTGNVTLTDVVVTDTFTAPAGPELVVTCPVTTLAPSESTTCTATYPVTQADVDNGVIANSAIATGTPPNGNPPVDSLPSEATVEVPADPSVTIVKTADPTTVTAAGDTVAYSFVVSNTGNVTLTDVVVTDTFTAPAGPELVVTCPVTTLAPTESTTCTATYTVTQADVDAGSIQNSAIATGTPPNGGAPVDSEPSEATVSIPADPSIAIVKTADPTTVDNAGDSVAYSFVVTNTGNVTLTDVAVTDTFTAPAGPELVVTCPVTTLAPAESTTCTATYTVTQADVDNGSILNSATAEGIDPGGSPVVSAPSDAAVDIPSAPAITIVKTADPTTVNEDGETVAYSFLVTNTGNVTLTDVVVTDTFTAPAGPELSVSCPVTTLAPTESTTCTATYTVTQADVDNAVIDNSAIATGTPPGGGAPVDSEPSTATVTIPPAPAIAIVKTADPTTVGVAGDTVTYSFVVTNTGNDTLTDIVVTDTFTAPAAPELVVTCPVTTLAPDEATTCSATYTVTQADVDNGVIDNSAVATGAPPKGLPPVTSQPSTATVEIPADPSVTIVKSADPTSVSAAGAVVDYSFVVTNTGNVTLSDVVVTDTFTAPAGPELTVTCPVTTLAPAEATTCTAAYTVTQADVDNGVIVNSAIATGTPPGDSSPVDSEPSTATVNASPAPSIDLDKVAGEPTVDGGDLEDVTDAGDTIDYTFVVTNTGNVTLTDIIVTDPKVGAITCPVTTLAPGASTTCTAAPYVLTQGDLDAAAVANTANVIGTPPSQDEPVTDTDTVTVPLTTKASLTLVKTARLIDADGDGKADAGEIIEFSFAVTNTGNVTITDVTVDDPKLNAVDLPCTPSDLAPGAVAACGPISYTVTAADVAAGSVKNVATAQGNAPPGTCRSDEDGTCPATSPPSQTETPTTEADPLPQTGDRILSFLPWAGGLILLGLGLIIATTRRREHDEASEDLV